MTQEDLAPEAQAQANPETSLMTLEEALVALARCEETLSVKEGDVLRLHADMENLRKRTANELAQARKFALESFAGELLAVMDSLEAAQQVTESSLESYRSGVELTARQLTSVFDKFHISAIHPEGQRFDPNRHQAIASLEHDEIPAQNVISVMQKGFALHERVLRTALVTVSKGKNASTS